MAERLAQLQGHLSNNFPGGMLANQTAIITGAGQGIGAEAAYLFAKEGARVVVADIDAAKAQQVVARIEQELGGKAVAVAGDIMKQSVIDEVVKAAATLGDGKIHHIVNNAVRGDWDHFWCNLTGCGGANRASLGTACCTRPRTSSGTPS